MSPSLLVLLGVLATAPSPEATALLVRHECHRCHEVERVAPPTKERDCAGCHREIASSEGDEARTRAGRELYGPAWAQFVERAAAGYCHVPPLAAMDRFRPEWLRDFLRAPYDLRPNLLESMIRHNLTDAEIDVLVAGWGARSEERSPPARPGEDLIRRGEALFADKSCGACHLMGNRPFEVAEGFQFEPMPKLRPRALAPDLRHTRDRMTLATIEAFIRDPRSVLRSAAMPQPEVSVEEAAALAAFVAFGELGPPAAPARRRPPPYQPSAPVPRYEEVEEKVFKRTCWHCHSNPDSARGDGGPGNSGGFGFPRGGLSFASFEEVMSGSVGPNGKRRSIFRRGESGEPVLLERLRQRYVENDRDLVLPGQDDLKDHRAPRSDAPRGMPLGLPALGDEEFSLVERWVKGGRPAPRVGAGEAPEPAEAR